jgi:hypothetical protein
MAHSCPDCGQACYCGGDIGVILLDGTDEQEACTHCPCPRDDDDEAECDLCGCTQNKACLGGCGWSDSYLEAGRRVCTSCEEIADAFERAQLLTLCINLGALDI